MLGGQQIRAYKTIMKTPRHRPRRSKSDIRLFHVIVWVAVAITVGGVATALAIDQFASIERIPDPVFLSVIPIALTFYFCWWWTDIAPAVGRWLIMATALIATIGCFLLAWVLPFWGHIQLAVLFVYLAAVSRVTWLQLKPESMESDQAESV